MLGGKAEISISAVDAHQTFVINNNYPGSAASVQVLASLPAWIAYVFHPPVGHAAKSHVYLFWLQAGATAQPRCSLCADVRYPERGAPQRL